MKTATTLPLRAAIYDMDGLLIDSEPLWQRAEQQIFASVGLELTSEMCQETTGLRIDEVVRYWYALRPWHSPAPEALPPQIVSRVVELVLEEGRAKEGVLEALNAVRDAGLRLALATSSPPVLIDAVLERLELVGVFEFIHSAVNEPYGKPHPAVFLSTSRLLGVEPVECLVLEDSLNGVIAAKAARMACIAVPEVTRELRGPFAIADVIVDSLLEVDQKLIESLKTA